MNAYSWQHFRDEAAQDSEKDIFERCVALLQLDTVGYMLCLVGYDQDELLGIISEGDEEVRFLRDILATGQYLCQFEASSTVRTWFIGIHPGYNDWSPADLFRYRQSEILIKNLKNGERLFAPSA